MMEIELIERPIQVEVRYGGWITMKRASELLEASTSTMYSYCKLGLLNRVLFAGRSYVSWALVEKLLREGVPTRREAAAAQAGVPAVRDLRKRAELKAAPVSRPPRKRRLFPKGATIALAPEA